MNPEAASLRHLVIIPDGNGRWAQKHNLEIGEGHLRGALRAQQLVDWVLPRMDDLGIDVFTFWGFSTENWSRSAEEVSGLMRLTENSLVDRADQLIGSRVRFKHIGRKDGLPHSLIKQMDFLEEKSAMGSKTFILALNYGGRDEIIRAISKIGDRLVDEETFKQYLDTAGLPDPDLIIRTAGEIRTSGIYPYQGVYAEIVSSPAYFPDFDEIELQRCLDEYYKRNRRFGGRTQSRTNQPLEWLGITQPNFLTYLEALKPEIEKASQLFLDRWRRDKFYNSSSLQEDINVYERLLAGGKHLRAALVILGFENFDGEGHFRQGALLGAVGYEMLHNSFLIHDDIEDNSTTRRHQPSVHEEYRIKHQVSGGLADSEKYGIALALNTGSLGPLRTQEVLWSVDNRMDRKIAAQQWMRQVIEVTLLGQRRDLTEIPLSVLTEKQVYEIYHQKTAVYSIIGPFVLGAILAGASRQDLRYITPFGVNLGIAFQMIDDHLGLYGNEEILGKPVGSDLREAKKTLHFVRAYQKASATQRQILQETWGHGNVSEDQINQIELLIEDLGVKDEVLAEAEYLANKAKLWVSRFTFNPTLSALLEELADYVVKRDL